MLKKLLLAIAAFFAVATMAFAAVDVNSATKEQLDSIPGIGPALADRIVEERKKGSYKDVNDLVERVRGIGPENVKKMQSGGLTVGGGRPGASAKPADTKKDSPAAAAKPADSMKDAPKSEVKPADMKKESPKADSTATEMKKDMPKAGAKEETKEDKKAARAQAKADKDKADKDKPAGKDMPKADDKKDDKKK